LSFFGAHFELLHDIPVFSFPMIFGLVNNFLDGDIFRTMCNPYGVGYVILFLVLQICDAYGVNESR
jgi:hypothetical protein